MNLSDQIDTILQDPSVTDIHIRENMIPWVRSEIGNHFLLDCEPTDSGVIQSWLDAHVFTDCKSRLQAKNGAHDFAVSIRAHRLRGQVFLVGGQIGIVLRKLSEKLLEFKALGIPDKVLELCSKSRGLVAITGATGSGKSTTCASIINHFNNTRSEHIITAEDPIEYLFKSNKSLITQLEIGPDADSPSYGECLKSALRKDFDTLFIGEVRGRETMDIALEAAETGHLVMITLHTNGAYQTIERIASFYDGAERAAVLNVLASVLCGVVSQVAMRDRNKKICLGVEVLNPTNPIRNLIKKNDIVGIRSEMYTGSKDGQLLLNDSLLKLIDEGRIDHETALSAAFDRDELEKRL
jgi:twitching motility protein PilT